MAEFQIRKAGEGEYYFTFTSPKWAILISGFYQGPGEASCDVESMKQKAAEDCCYSRNMSENGKTYFSFKMDGPDAIGQSPMYDSPSQMEDNIEYLKKHASSARVEFVGDETLNQVRCQSQALVR